MTGETIRGILHEAVEALMDGAGVEWLYDERGGLLGFQLTFPSAADLRADLMLASDAAVELDSEAQRLSS